MQYTIIMGIILIAFVSILNRSNKKNDDNSETENQKFNLKKLIYGVVLFIPFFIAYYIIIVLISSIPLLLSAGAASGAWVLAMLLGYVGAPILSIITIVKILNKK